MTSGGNGVSVTGETFDGTSITGCSTSIVSAADASVADVVDGDAGEKSPLMEMPAVSVAAAANPPPISESQLKFITPPLFSSGRLTR